MYRLAALTVALLSTVLTFHSPRSAYAVAYPAGWNLVSGPTGSTLTGAVGPLYTLAAGDDDYGTVPAGTTLLGCNGYWAYFPNGGSITFGPSGDVCRRPMPKLRWALIGNPSSTDIVDLNGVNSVLTYTPTGGYVVAQRAELAPGQGALIQADGTNGDRVDVLARSSSAAHPLSATGCAPTEARTAASALSPLVQEFSDNLAIARATPRVGLSPILTQLQATHRQEKALQVPDCALAAQADFDFAMDWYVMGLTDFLSLTLEQFAAQENAHGDEFWADGMAELRELRSRAGR